MALWAEELTGAPDPRWWAMESLLLQMRSLWFQAAVLPFHCGRLVAEPDGEMIGLVAGSPEEADALVAEAARRRAYVVTTPFTRPEDLPLRLRGKGYHLVSRQGTYIYDPEVGGGPQSDPNTRGRRLLNWWRRPPVVAVEEIGRPDLPRWNAVCFGAFGPRGQTEATSLTEKQRAYAAMGDRARWYMAWLDDQPAGCAILYDDGQVAQVLAVGTLPRFRGQGVASAVVRRLIQDWTARGSNGFLFLDTRPGSQAERIYMQLGFVRAYLRSVYAP